MLGAGRPPGLGTALVPRPALARAARSVPLPPAVRCPLSAESSGGPGCGVWDRGRRGAGPARGGSAGRDCRGGGRGRAALWGPWAAAAGSVVVLGAAVLLPCLAVFSFLRVPRTPSGAVTGPARGWRLRLGPPGVLASLSAFRLQRSGSGSLRFCTALRLSMVFIFLKGVGKQTYATETVCVTFCRSLLASVLGHGWAARAEKVALDRGPFPPPKLREPEF